MLLINRCFLFYIHARGRATGLHRTEQHMPRAFYYKGSRRRGLAGKRGTTPRGESKRPLLHPNISSRPNFYNFSTLGDKA